MNDYLTGDKYVVWWSMNLKIMVMRSMLLKHWSLRTFGLIRYDQEIGLLVAARVKTLGVEEEHVMMGVLGRTGCKYCTQKLS